VGTQTIAVSGASGLVGGRLVQLLKAAGHTVLPISRRSTDGSTILWEPDRGFLNPARLEGVDAIVHLAGENIAAGRWSPAQKQKIRDSRVQGTRSLVESLKGLTKRPKTLVCASAIGFYGDRGDEVLNEQSAPGSGFLVDVCREWEAAAATATDLGMRVVLGAGGIIGNGRQYWSWIGVTDAARVFAYCVEHPEISGPVNAVSPHTATNFDFTKTLGSVLRRPTIFPLPGFMAKIVLGEMAGPLLLASARVTPDALRKAGFTFSQPGLRECLEAELK
jgi:NAD dependent epimerase/dehydratase family enzyme